MDNNESFNELLQRFYPTEIKYKSIHAKKFATEVGSQKLF